MKVTVKDLTREIVKRCTTAGYEVVSEPLYRLSNDIRIRSKRVGSYGHVLGPQIEVVAMDRAVKLKVRHSFGGTTVDLTRQVSEKQDAQGQNWRLDSILEMFFRVLKEALDKYDTAQALEAKSQAFINETMVGGNNSNAFGRWEFKNGSYVSVDCRKEGVKITMWGISDAKAKKFLALLRKELGELKPVSA